MPSVEVILYALLGGILPALVWLWFLLREDARCPEPKPIIALALLAGMIAVPLVLPLEQIAASLLPTGLSTIVAWATIEETVKYLLAAVFILWRREVDESIDLVIYMFTIALGFAALENALFLVAPFSGGDVLGGLVTDNLRFLGSTLLHVIASSAIGFALALSFTKPPYLRTAFAAAGLILAIALHALFNFLIIEQSGSTTLLAFFLVWSSAIAFFALFETLRYFRYRHLPNNTC
ncbi:MAG: hypothetical protein JWN64_347 [Parcubacteria group bacterium]|nr:hypothetical protein [Parcubacteria group bacterium]